MPLRRTTHIPGLLEFHAQELGFLWSQRANRIQSPDYRIREMKTLEERIEAHADALVGNTEAARDAMVGMISSDDSDLMFAGAFGILRLNEKPLLEKLVEAYANADAVGRRVVVEAICNSANKVASQLWKTRFGRDPGCLFDTAEISAFHCPTDFAFLSLEQRLRDPDPLIRKTAWRVALLFSPTRLPPQVTLAGALDDDPVVRRYALEAAAWAKQPWIIKHCQTAAAKAAADHLEEVRILAVLGSGDDLKLVLAACDRAPLGSSRFEVLGSLGHPDAVLRLIDGMTGRETESAELAGNAFMRITGLQLPTVLRSANAMDQELQIEVRVPDGKNAAAQWQESKFRFVSGVRWAGGVEIAEIDSQTILPTAVDMLTRWETNLRLAFRGQSHRAPVDLLRIPLR